MSFQALLFCPDERTARVVSQVLSDLDFKAECCSEPFVAVKRLMAQRYDAIVVECDNEQNASLVLKSARNSQNNQNSLTVAVVEGQAGVANAFRIGANLVLTKPIAVEQAKSTLRVARGLLRKADAPRSAAPATAPAAPIVAAAPLPVSQPAKPGTLNQVQSMMPPTLPAAPTVSVTPSASAFLESEKEPEMAPEAGEAALLESINHVTPAPAPSTAAADVPDMAEARPLAPVGLPPRPAIPPGLPLNTPVNTPVNTPAHATSAAKASGSTGLAAAPAKELVRPAAPLAAAPVQAKADDEILLADPSENVTYPRREEPIAAPVFGSYQEEAPQRSRKPLIAILVLVLLAATGYMGWTRLKPRLMAGKTAAAAAPAPAPASAPSPGPQSRPVDAQLQPNPEITPDTTNAGNAQPVAEAKEPAVENETNSKPSAAKPAYEPPEVVTIPTPQPTAPAPKPLQVKTELQRTQVAKPQEPMPLPSPNSVAANAQTDLASIMRTPTVVPTVAPAQTVRVSQGVSQGLLIRRVQPVYPSQAMQMRLQGTVVLQAVINKQGVIKDVKAISGEPLLSRAAIDAVKQWKYNPYYLNGEPVDIQTQISVVFRLP
jgi:periplasmic protein TonB